MTSNNRPPRLISVEDAAELWNVSIRHARRAIQENNIRIFPFPREGGGVKFFCRRTDVEQLGEEKFAPSEKPRVMKAGA